MTLTIINDDNGKVLATITGSTNADCEAQAAEYGTDGRTWTYNEIETAEDGTVKGWTPEGYNW